MNVLPSPAMDEVHTMTFCPSFSVNSKLARMPLKISSMALLWFSLTTISPSPLACFDAVATSDMMGSLVSRSTSSRPPIL